MKHHLYSIYLGGAKDILLYQYYCKECQRFFKGNKKLQVHYKKFVNNDK